MTRTKVMIAIDPDVLAVIDARAERHGMTRSGYIAAASMGLLDRPGPEFWINSMPEGPSVEATDGTLDPENALKVTYDVVTERNAAAVAAANSRHLFRSSDVHDACYLCGRSLRHRVHAP